MELHSSISILQKELGTSYDETKVFMAENIIINYLMYTPEEWDETLSIATAHLTKRLGLDNGIKSEGRDGHSVTLKDIKSTEDLLGGTIIALLSRYMKTPTASMQVSGNFQML